jgi:hypothetical protein
MVRLGQVARGICSLYWVPRERRPEWRGRRRPPRIHHDLAEVLSGAECILTLERAVSQVACERSRWERTRDVVLSGVLRVGVRTDSITLP